MSAKSLPENASKTHADLVKLAHGWLTRPHSKKGPGCTIAVTETQNGISSEVPDALGWRPFGSRRGSILVEVKVSRQDFLADKNKPHRKDENKGMGVFRYYLAPKGVITEADLPAKWGLIEVVGDKTLKVVAGHVLAHWSSDCKEWEFETNKEAELSMLAMVVARTGDPQKVQDRIRESSRVVAALQRDILAKTKRIDELERQLIDALNTLHANGLTVTPRRRRG